MRAVGKAGGRTGGRGKRGWFSLAPEELSREIDYLSKKGLIALKEGEISKGFFRWEATAAATEYCEKEGLV